MVGRVRLFGCGFALLVTGCGSSTPPATEPNPPHPDVIAPAPSAPSSGPDTATTPSAAPTAAAPPATTAGIPTASPRDAQLIRGRELYAAECASCHGATGHGGKSPPLVGLGAGALALNPPKTAKYRKVQFRTAADVLDFMVKTMPPTAPESLVPADAHALLAFLLEQNGVAWGSEPADATVARRLEIPRP